MTETQMPLANGMSVVPGIFEIFWHDLDVGSESSWH